MKDVVKRTGNINCYYLDTAPLSYNPHAFALECCEEVSCATATSKTKLAVRQQVVALQEIGDLLVYCFIFLFYFGQSATIISS